VERRGLTGTDGTEVVEMKPGETKTF
jgi:hypothetical protein